MAKRKKFSSCVAVLMVVILLIQILTAFGITGFCGQVYAEATGITGQTGDSGAIYYDVSDGAQITGGSGVTTTQDAGAAIASTDGITFSGKAFRESGGWGTASLTVTINVAEAGDYYVAFGVAKNQTMNVNLKYSINGSSNASIPSATETDDAKWYDCGVVSLVAGDNTVKIARSAYGQVVGPLDVIRIIKFIPPECTVSVQTDGTEGASVTGSGTYPGGTEATVSATIPDGYLFAGWKNTEGATVSSENPYTFEVAEDVSLTATFEAVETIISGKTGTSGAIYYDVSHAAQLITGGNANPTVMTPAITSTDGVTFSGKAFGDNAGYGSSNLSVKINVADAGEYYVAFGVNTTKSIFTACTYSVASSAAAAFSSTTTETDDDATWYNCGRFALNAGENTIKIARTGYNHWCGPLDVIRIIKYIPPECTVSVNTDGTEGASVTGAGAYTAGTQATVSATIPDGYVFTGWKDSDGKVISTANPYTFTVFEDITLSACFEETVVVVALQPHNDTKDGKIYYKGNADGAIIKDGKPLQSSGSSNVCRFPDGSSVGTAWHFRSITGLDSEITINLYVEEAGDYLLDLIQCFSYNSLEISVNGSEVVIMKDNSQQGNYLSGDMHTEGNVACSTVGTFAFKEGVNTITMFPGSGSHAQVDTLRLTKVQMATVFLNTDGTPNSTVDGSGRYMVNSDIEIEASAPNGYVFIGWKNNAGEIVSTENPYTYTVTEDTVLTACFSSGTYEFNHVQHMTMYIPENQQDYTLGGSPTGGHQHTYCGAPGQVATFHLSGIDAGIYEMYYLVPLVHSNNSRAWVVEAKDSFGNYSKNTLNAWVSSNQADVMNNVSSTGIRTGDWVKLAGQFTFYQGCDGTVTVTQGPNTAGHNRYCRVRLVKVGDVSGKPLATNVAVTGSNKLGGTLNASYNYIDPNNIVEKDSAYKWYAKSTANDAWVEVASGTTTADVGSAYTLKNEEKFAKFEIIPKSANNNSDLAIGTMASAEFTVTAEDKIPVARDVVVSGSPYLGAELTGTYTYFDENGDIEGNSKYRWLVSDDMNADFSEWTVLDQGICNASTPIVFTIPVNVPSGSYITLEIVPCNVEDTLNKGISRYSVPIGPIENTNILPAVDNLKFAGQVVNAEGLEGLAINGTAEVDYTFNYLLGTAEDTNATAIQWYRGNSQNGPWTAISGATGRSYTPTSADSAKYICYGVVPAAQDGHIGEEVLSPARIVRWNLKFADEFEYTAANGKDATFASKWNTENGSRDLGVATARIPDNVYTEDGKMKIVTKKEYNPNYPFEHEYTTSSVWTKEAVGPYGYYETSMKYAAASGLNQSFWSRGANGNTESAATRFVELDFCEGHYPNRVNSTLHAYDASTQNKYSDGYVYFPYGTSGTENMSQSFTVIGGYLKPNDSNYSWNATGNLDTYRTYANNELYRSTSSTSYVPASQNIYCSIAVYPGWAGEVIDSMVHGSIIEYEYVRFYEEIGINQSGANDYSIANAELSSAKAEAADLIANAVIGNETGNYSSAAKANLQAALTTANAVTENGKKLNAAIALNNAIQIFKDSEIGDRSELERAIVMAEKVLVSTSVGTGDGQSPEEYYRALDSTITTSKNLVNSDAPTQAQLDAQTQSLQVVTDNLVANIIGDVVSTPDEFTVTIENAAGTVTGAGIYEYGTEITIEATGDDYYTFDYWQEGDKILSDDAAYTFVVTADRNFTAQFKAAEAETYKVVFKNVNGVILGTVEVAAGGTLENADGIPIPTQYGKEFDCWSKTFPIENITSDIIISPKFVVLEDAEKYTVVANGETIAEDLPFDTKVTVTADAVNGEGEVFSYWQNQNGKIVSYCNEYIFFVSSDVTLTAVYGASTPVNPIIKSDNVIIDRTNSKMSFVSQVVVPKDYTLIECGTLFFNKDMNFTLGTTGVVKVKARAQTDAGQFMATLSNVGLGKVRYARGYLVYKDAQGNLTTVYGEILSGTME